MSAADLPDRALLEHQAARLAGMRSRLLRRVGIARRGPVLDLGSGPGVVTAELARRAKGPVVALDPRPEALAQAPGVRLRARAEALPLRTASIDLVFAQHLFLWLPDWTPVLEGVRRVLRPGGVVVAVEPDYDALVEYPREVALRDVWRPALLRAGAVPEAGRRLAPAFEALGMRTTVDLLPSVPAPDADRFALLEGLGLTAAERERLAAVRRAQEALGPRACVVHLPYFFVTAEAG